MKLQVENLTFSYGAEKILQSVSFEHDRGGLFFLLGANGAGKSTLFKLISGILKPESGRILLDGRDISTLSRRETAQTISVSWQHGASGFDLTAGEFVLFGRNARLSRWGGVGRKDMQAVEQAMEMTGTSRFAGRNVSTLSGGELQSLKLAANLALSPEIMLLDEPGAAHDPARNHQLFSLLKSIAAEKTVIVVSHDIASAQLYADKILLLGNGSVLDSGSPEKVLTPENLAAAYHAGKVEEKEIKSFLFF